MNADRFQQITSEYAKLRVAVVGDFCLDRYLEIDPSREETSIETGLPVHNVVNVRAQPGGAGTVLNNLSALGVGEIYPVGFCGDDGEGLELSRALFARPGVKPDYFFKTDQRRTFTYCKPLIVTPGSPPVELSRLDTKNWTPTPSDLEGDIINAIEKLHERVDAFILLDQTPIAETGVITRHVLAKIHRIQARLPQLLIIADSRHRLKNFPRCSFKVNRAEFCQLMEIPDTVSIDELRSRAEILAKSEARKVFVTLAGDGILGAFADGQSSHLPALPLRGSIDIVGAGDAVTANLATALAADASLKESLEIANAAASVVIHQLGTTGTANIAAIQSLLSH